jgi:uncharacterized protein YqgQ
MNAMRPASTNTQYDPIKMQQMQNPTLTASRTARPGETDNTGAKAPVPNSGLSGWNPQVGTGQNAHGMYTMGATNPTPPAGVGQGPTTATPPAGQANSGGPMYSFSGPTPNNPGMSANQFPNQYQAPYNASNSPMNSFLQNWQTNAGDYSKWGSDDYREQATGYAGSYAAPYIAAQQAERTQMFNEQSTAANMAMQNWLNQSQVGLDWAGNAREDRALSYGEMSGNREFAEGQRQFDTTSGLTERQMGQQFTLGTREADTAAARARNEFTLGTREADNAATRNQNELHLGEGALRNEQVRNDIDRMFRTGQLNNEQYANATARFTAESQAGIQREQNQIEQQYRNGLINNEQYANATARLAQASQDEQWRGQLGFQNRELTENMGWNREQLAQQMGWNREELGVQAALQREGYANQLQQSRYGAFGRSQAPNQTAWARSWG